MAPRIIVDDTDPRVRYSGEGWFQDHGTTDNIGIFGPTYNHTSHGTKSGGSVSFTFEGTFFQASGTLLGPNADEGTPDVTFECSIDKVILETEKLLSQVNTGNYGTLCNRDNLNDGRHELTINVTGSSRTFWLDYFLFQPSTSAVYNEPVLWITNSDPSLLFGSGWTTSSAYSKTNVTNSQVRFNFVGKRVTWVGVANPNFKDPATASYSIDDGAPTTFNLTGQPTSWNLPLFTTPDLPPGPHSLLVTYNGGDGPAAQPLSIQTIYLTNSSIPQPSAAGSSTPGSTSTATPGDSQHASNGKSETPVGAIVGGVVGGLALVTLVLFLFRWKRRQGRAIPLVPSEFRLPVDGSAPHETSPFMPVYEGEPRSYTADAQPLPHNMTHVLPTRVTSVASSSAWSGDAPGTVSQALALHKAQEAAGMQRQGAGHVLHEDSGFRMHSSSQQPQGATVEQEHVPPQYTAD